MRKAFTLLEVNLAILVLAVGVLGMAGLYSFGFSESRQSKEDVAAASFAGAYLVPLAQALSSTDLKWSQWVAMANDGISESESRQLGGASGILPANGWGDYVQVSGDRYQVISNPRAKAKEVFDKIRSATGVAINEPSVPNIYEYGLVATRCGARMQLAFRLARRRELLLAQPLFVYEVFFQGDPEQ